jgi:hypothetical protein
MRVLQGKEKALEFLVTFSVVNIISRAIDMVPFARRAI